MMSKPKSSPHPKPELLAPVGHVESFFAAVEHGADAVYLGLKQLSARASATNFTLSDLALLVPYAHRRNIAVHVAVNSLVTAPEFPGVLDVLQSLSDLEVDALIVQDPGILFLIRRFFPRLKIHVSTLTTIHNHAGVNELERQGAHRVVLARELRLEEIEQIAARTRVELEIFIHGALCYSYSGLCLASSFRGGHSGLQGRCVQPCRLRFRQGGKEGFFLSCNDFCALPLIPKLKRMRLASFKIEGRMKQADYIAQVVRAYRLVMDAPQGKETEAVAQAQEWLLQSPSRRFTTGSLLESSVSEVLTPHRSGSSGLWVGSIEAAQEGRVVVALRHELRVGDRLRPEGLQGKEREAFTVSELFAMDGSPLQAAQPGKKVRLSVEGSFVKGERLFKVGSKTRSAASLWNTVRQGVSRAQRFSKKYPKLNVLWEDWPTFEDRTSAGRETLILKVGQMGDLLQAFQSSAAWVMLTATRQNLERVAKQKLIPAQKKRFVWSIPPLIAEKEIDYFRSAFRWFQKKGFVQWELNNWGHFDLLEDRESLSLIAGYRFNLRNLAALRAMAEAGCRWSVLSLEITRTELEAISRGPLSTQPILTLHAWPPLFTSSLLPRLQEDKPLVSPRRESYLFRKQGKLAFLYADAPLDWLDHLSALRAFGFRSFLLDVSDGPTAQGPTLERLLSAFKRGRADKPFSLFNLDRRP